MKHLEQRDVVFGRSQHIIKPFFLLNLQLSYLILFFCVHCSTYPLLFLGVIWLKTSYCLLENLVLWSHCYSYTIIGVVPNRIRQQLKFQIILIFSHYLSSLLLTPCLPAHCINKKSMHPEYFYFYTLGISIVELFFLQTR